MLTLPSGHITHVYTHALAGRSRSVCREQRCQPHMYASLRCHSRTADSCHELQEIFSSLTLTSTQHFQDQAVSVRCTSPMTRAAALSLSACACAHHALASISSSSNDRIVRDTVTQTGTLSAGRAQVKQARGWLRSRCGRCHLRRQSQRTGHHAQTEATISAHDGPCVPASYHFVTSNANASQYISTVIKNTKRTSRESASLARKAV